MVHPENAKCFVRLFSQSQLTTEEEYGVGGGNGYPGRLSWGPGLKDGVPQMCVSRGREGEEAPRLRSLKWFFARVQTKRAKPSQGRR